MNRSTIASKAVFEITLDVFVHYRIVNFHLHHLTPQNLSLICLCHISIRYFWTSFSKFIFRANLLFPFPVSFVEIFCDQSYILILYRTYAHPPYCAHIYKQTNKCAAVLFSRNWSHNIFIIVNRKEQIHFVEWTAHNVILCSLIIK